ncbi:g3070 [Coccomyxa viridis]|uniref:G3070 protein n=1 Tax=Coccomyxa viridis TaxID=1274662 RepID=A0ABP1FP75_9CHLO
MCDCIEHVQAHHCTGSDTVVGSANVSSSIFAMLFVGWLIGLAMGSGLVLYLRRRRRYGTGTKELPLTTSPAAAKTDNDRAQIRVRHVKTESAAIRDEAVRTSGAEGPLGAHLVMQSIDSKAVPPFPDFGQLKKPAGELWSNVDLTSEKGGAGSKPASMALMPLEMPAEPYEPLKVKVDARTHEAPGANGRASLPEAGTAGLIKANWAGGRRSDRSLPAGSLYSSSHNDAMSIREAAAAKDQGRPQSRPPIPPPLPPTHERSFKPAAGSQAKPDQAAQSHTAQPAEALSTDGQLRKQEKKSKAAAVVAQAYDMDDLDDGWHALLNELEDRLLQAQAQGMDATDRAVAIRSLIHSTGREEPEVALNMALKDILRHRRAAA